MPDTTRIPSVNFIIDGISATASIRSTAATCLGHRAARRARLFFSALWCVLLSSGVFGLTTGPSEPTAATPTALSTSNLVDPFTGDFQYSIPILELPGPRGSFPLVIKYQSGITTEQEASWVGLGWALEPGRIARSPRGIPDDVANSELQQLFYQRPATAVGVGGSVGAELFGLDSRLLSVEARLGMDVFFDSYSGYGMSLSLSPKANLAVEDNLGGSLGAEASLNTHTGTTTGVKMGLNLGLKNLNPSYGASYSTRTGLESAYWGHGALPLFTPSYISANQRSQFGARTDFSIRVGPEFQGVYPSGEVKGYVSRTIFDVPNSLKAFESIVALPEAKRAFGYLYLHEGQAAGSNAQLDFTREKDSPLKPRTPVLPFAVLAADRFSLITPTGLGGSFRAFRNDISVVGDPKVESHNVSAALAGEVGVGTVVHVGASGEGATAENLSSAWNNNDFAEMSLATSAPPTNSGGERTYFALLSELSTEATDASARHSEEPQFISLPSTTEADWLIRSMSGSQEPPVSSNTRKPRATYIRAVTEAEVQAPSSPWRAKFTQSGITRPTIGEGLNNKRVAGFEVVAIDGTRYVFAQPAYVSIEINCVFAVDPASVADDATFLVGQSAVLAPETENLINQWFRRLSGEEVAVPDPEDVLPSSSDQFLSCTSTPPYAHTYYLTAVLGPRYVDADGIDGPSDGDLGHWVRFEYERVGNYVFRSPYEGAHYDRGYEASYLGDDRASIAMGRKELFYLKRALTASHEVVLDLKDRADALSAVDPATGLRVSPKRIESIELRPLGSDAEHPLTKVTFGYTYELAQGTPNSEPSRDPIGESSGGKLTLGQLSITYGGNASGLRSPYQFSYGTTASSNPDYQALISSADSRRRRGDKNSDRWGYYQPCNGLPSYREAVETGAASDGRCSNGEAPYTSQDIGPSNTREADVNAAAWSLRSIVTPSGAQIDVSYEADDYAFVQNERAAIMVPVKTPSCLSDAAPITDADHQNPQVCVDLSNVGTYPDSAPSTPEEARIFVEHLLTGVGGHAAQLAYSADVLLRPDGPNGAMWQTITGYVEIADGPTYPRDYSCSNGRCAVNIPLQKALGEYHPIAFAGWQHLKLNQPQYGVPGVSPMQVNDAGFDQLKEAALGLVNMVVRLNDVFQDYASQAKDEGWANRVRNAKVRLFEPSGFKHGGGARVSSVTICDLSNGSDVDCSDPRYAIGNTYSYTVDEDNRTISSGVAAYEPALGGDEISLRRAEFFSDHRILAPNDPAYFEHPIAESLFPAPMVGYRRVVERTLAGEHAAINPTSNVATSGERVYEFYTAKEFPVRVQASIIQKPAPIQDILHIPAIGSILDEKFAASQGFRVEISDSMHGRPRRVSEYALTPDGSRVDGAYRETTYIYNVAAGAIDRLDPNSVSLFSVPEIDIQRDALGQRIEYYADMRLSKASSGGAGLAINTDTIMTLVPIPIPVPWPSYDDSVKESRTSAFHQIVHRNGVLVRVETRDRSAFRVNENIVFDPYSGEAVLSSVTNAFGEVEYSFVLPSYRLHPRMGPAFASELNSNLLTSDAIRLRAATNPLINPARQCVGVLKSPWIRTIEDVLDVSLSLNWNRELVDDQLLQRHASPITVESFHQDGGPWAPIATYRFDSVREYKDNPSPREDGRYKDDVVIPLTDLEAPPIDRFELLVEECAPQWKLVERVQKYHPRGPPLESTTPLDRNDAMLLGQKAGLVRAVARNARYEEIAFEGFESYKVGLSLAPTSLDDGNFDFWSDSSLSIGHSQGALVYPRTRIEGGSLIFEFDRRNLHLRPDPSDFKLPLDARVWFKSHTNEQICRDVRIVQVAELQNHVAATLAVPLNVPDTSAITELPDPAQSRFVGVSVPAADYLTGRPFGRCPSVEVTKRSHTGSRSIVVHKTVAFEQNRLKLQPNRYVLGAWVSRWHTDVTTFASSDETPNDERIGIGVRVGEQTTLFEPVGPIVDGWQRVEGEFSVLTDEPAVQIFVQTGLIGRLYVDDIRVHPQDASMLTFVYDLRRNQLAARHDESNFSMRWQYDEAGQLRLAERETLRGWRTITEHMFHQAEKP